MPADPTRRRVLAASVLAAAAAGPTACGRIMPWSVPPRKAPDVGVLVEAIAAEQGMISRYESVIARFPSLGPALTPVLDQHREHLAALRGRLVVPPGTPTPSATLSASAHPPSAHRPSAHGPSEHGPSEHRPSEHRPSEHGTASPPAPRPPALPSAAAALAYLRTAEEGQAAAMVRRLPVAVPSLAQLLASIGASEASHTVVLRSAGRRG